MSTATASGAILPPAATAPGPRAVAAPRPFGSISLSELRQRAAGQRAFDGPSFDDVLADRVPPSEGWGEEPFFWAELHVQDERWVDGEITDPPQSPRHGVLLVAAGLLSAALLVGVAVMLIVGVDRATQWLPALMGT